jgi:hypothetical protein
MKQSPGILIPVILLLFVFSHVWANDTSVGGIGANIYPVAETAIRMESELLIINYPKPFSRNEPAYIETTFTFSNTGEARTVTIGFPENYDDRFDHGLYPGIVGFMVTVDGVKVDTVYQPLAKRNEQFNFNRAYLWRVYFAKGQRRVIRNSYQYYPTYSTNGDWRVEYILKTGAMWAGSVGRMDIVVNCPTVVRSGFNKPPWMNYVPYPEEYSWFHTENWEPDRDILLTAFYHRDSILQNRGKILPEWQPFITQNETDGAAYYRSETTARRALIRTYITSLPLTKLTTLTKQELQIYINGIYATYGRPFKDPEWDKFFNAKWWYQPDPAYSDAMLTPPDQKTLNTLLSYLPSALETKK